jgi:hypothetical protein
MMVLEIKCAIFVLGRVNSLQRKISSTLFFRSRNPIRPPKDRDVHPCRPAKLKGSQAGGINDVQGARERV